MHVSLNITSKKKGLNRPPAWSNAVGRWETDITPRDFDPSVSHACPEPVAEIRRTKQRTSLKSVGTPKKKYDNLSDQSSSPYNWITSHEYVKFYTEYERKTSNNQGCELADYIWPTSY